MLCPIPFTEQHKLALIRIERGGGDPGAQLSKQDKYIRMPSLRNGHLKSSTDSFIK
jgi:hypothetical protein